MLPLDQLDPVPALEAPVCNPGFVTPAVEWPVRTELAADRIAALDALLFPPGLDRADPERAGVRTDGVVIVHRGVIVYERYADGWDRDARHLAWSATKTFTNALAGIAVREGLLSIDDPICRHVEAARPESCAVTVGHLLDFSSGWDWHETYENTSPVSSSVLAMLYGTGRVDMARFVTAHPLRDPPGTSWMYSSGDTNVLSAVLRSVLAPTFGEDYPWRLLFEPLDMQATLERDGSGTYVGSSYLWATPRDLARFGVFLLHDGCWNGERLLPVGWIEASTQPSVPMRKKVIDRDPGDVQGRQIWLNRRVPEIGQTTLPWPSVPEGAYAARGHWGQAIAVIPSADLIVVRTADDRDGKTDFDRILALALALVEGT